MASSHTSPVAADSEAQVPFARNCSKNAALGIRARG